MVDPVDPVGPTADPAVGPTVDPVVGPAAAEAEDGEEAGDVVVMGLEDCDGGIDEFAPSVVKRRAEEEEGPRRPSLLTR